MSENNLNLIVSSAFFSEIDGSFFPEHRTLNDIIVKDCIIREYKKGDVVIREGDYGTSAFVIISGSAGYFHDSIPDKLWGRKSIRKKKSGFKLFFELISFKKNKRQSENKNRINNFEKIFEEYKKTLLEPGDIFGETSGRDPRSATVIANEKSTIVEIRWQGVRDLRKYSPEIQDLFESLYRSRSLEKTIKKNKLFNNLNEEEISLIIKEAILETKGKLDHDEITPDTEKEIISIGDYVNGLIIIRSGFARICDKQGQTIKYLSRGDSFGLFEIYKNFLEKKFISHQTSLIYLGHLETIFIPKHIVEDIIIPKINTDLLPNEDQTLAQADPLLLNFLVSNRFNNARSLMMIDLERCTRCNDCVESCSVTHQNIPRFKRDGKQFGKYLITKSCLHCSEPYCMSDCPTGAIYRDEINGEIVINEDTCIGCANCAENCIYECIDMLPRESKPFGQENDKAILKASKCDLCIEYNSAPACERSCPTEAIIRIDFSNFESLKKWSERKN